AEEIGDDVDVLLLRKAARIVVGHRAAQERHQVVSGATDPELREALTCVRRWRVAGVAAGAVRLLAACGLRTRVRTAAERNCCRLAVSGALRLRGHVARGEREYQRHHAAGAPRGRASEKQDRK